MEGTVKELRKNNGPISRLELTDNGAALKTRLF
jgi:hypothetical protein